MTATPATKLELSAEQSPQTSFVLSAQKAELIGELAQAMANHFNNVMMAVTGYAELELKKANTANQRALEQVLANATHATSLIQLLLDFSRKRASSPQLIDLNAVIREMSDLLDALLCEQMKLSLKLDAAPSTVYADRSDVQHALLAVFVAARNTLGSGPLIVSTSSSTINQEFIGAERAEPGEYVVFSVEGNSSVNGPSTNHRKADQPEASLEPVRAVVQELGGLVRFVSEPGTSNFRLFFPASGTQSIVEPIPTGPRIPATARTILVVEDDDAVRLPAAEFLKMEGFKVLQARTGSEALSVVEQSRSAVDILIADICMPKMSGHEVATQLLEQHPDLKVIYMSGDPGRSSFVGTRATSQDMTLRKPFRLNVLRDKIHDLLGE